MVVLSVVYGGGFLKHGRPSLVTRVQSIDHAPSPTLRLWGLSDGVVALK